MLKLKRIICLTLLIQQKCFPIFLRRYCLLNDRDTQLTPEAAFREYVRKMRTDGRLPKLCEYRKPLVDRFLFDMKATNGLTNLWDVNWKDNKK